MKIACVDTITPGNSMEERFQNLEKWGFDGIEIWGVVGEEGELDAMAKQVQELSASYKIKPACVVIASPAALAPFTEDFLESKLFAVKESIRIAAKLGAVTLYAMEEGAQSVPAISEAPVPSDEEREVMLNFFREAGKYAVDQGAILNLEPVNRYETHYINRVGQAIEICDTLGIESLKVMADSCELNMEESNIVEAIKSTKGYLHHFHLADNNRLMPGKGHINFKEMIDALKGIGYDKYMSFECAVQGSGEEEIQNALKYIRGLE